MELISDILLIAGALGILLYCIILSRKLNKFNNLEKGVGGAVALMSAQVDDMTKTLETAQSAAKSSATDLEAATQRAEAAVAKIELMLASLHDLPEAPSVQTSVAPAPAVVPVNEQTPPPTAFVRHRERTGS